MRLYALSPHPDDLDLRMQNEKHANGLGGLGMPWEASGRSDLVEGLLRLCAVHGDEGQQSPPAGCFFYVLCTEITLVLISWHRGSA